jgi:hypothetical protein
MTHIRAMMCLLFELSKVAVQTHRWPDDRLFVKAVYRACLKREPDADGEAFYLAALRQGSMSKVGILRSVLESNEFKQIYGLPVHPLNALHQARMMLIRQHLPMARVIVDLGGTAEDHCGSCPSTAPTRAWKRPGMDNPGRGADTLSSRFYDRPCLDP